MRRRRRAIGAIVAAGALAGDACHGARVRPVPSTAATITTDTTVRGTLRVVGASPQPAVLLGDSAGRFVLLGSLRSELATLDGALVEATGAVVDTPTPLGRRARSLQVYRYVIDSIAGGVPVVGTVAVRGDRVMVGGVEVRDPPPQLRAVVGAKVWVVGRRGADGRLTAQTFGVLATPDEHRKAD